MITKIVNKYQTPAGDDPGLTLISDERNSQRSTTGASRTPLFEQGRFVLHSGTATNWLINCDVLSKESLDTLARIITDKVGPFGECVGIPRGGLRIASALQNYVTSGPRLLVDDVLTSGASMEEMRCEGDKGAVIFARGPCPGWIVPVFSTVVAV